MTKKKLTIDQLIKDKDKITSKKEETKDLYVNELDAIITIEAPDRSLFIESFELAEDENHDGNGDEFMVYNIVVEPNLKDSELQKAYECVEPTDIVNKIFDYGTVTSIAQAGLELSGFDSEVTPVDELKN